MAATELEVAKARGAAGTEQLPGVGAVTPWPPESTPMVDSQGDQSSSLAPMPPLNSPQV